MTNASNEVRAYRAPIDVFINVNNLCNLRCPYCYSNSGPHARIAELTTSEVLDLADQMGAMGVLRTNILGGEPLIRADLLDLLARLRRHRIRVELTTNGTLLEREHVSELKRLGIHVTVSVDGGSEESNRQMRGEGSFAKAWSAVGMLVEAGLVPTISVTISRLNYRAVRDSIEAFARLGVRAFNLNRLYPTELVRKKWSELFPLPSESAALGREIVAIQDQRPELRLNGSYASWSNKYHRPKAQQASHQNDDYWICGAGISSCIVRPDAWVTPCNTMWEYKCGSLREQSLLEIWRNSTALAELRAEARKSYKEQKVCDGCNHQSECRGGCHAAAMQTRGTAFDRDPICWEKNGVARSDDDFRNYYRSEMHKTYHLPVLNAGGRAGS
jgi:radical SAM protein with 4Fe4S-binding SPASM domain